MNLAHSEGATPKESVGLPRRRTVRRVLGSRVTQLIAVEIVFIFLVTGLNNTFLTTRNFGVLTQNMALPAIVMAATVLLLGAGRFDLSIDGVSGLAGIVAGELMATNGAPPIVAIAAGLGVGTGIGLVNGLLIEVVGLNPFVTTIGTWWAAEGTSLGLTQGQSPYGFPDAFTTIGQSTVLGLPIITWYAIVLCAASAVVLRFTRFGAHILATGGDRESARLNGVKTARVGLILYVFSGFASALAGVLFAARLSDASPDAFTGLSLQVIAAAVIGGASLSGGRGNVVGGVLGLFLLSLFGDAAIYVGISAYWQEAISGIVLLAAIASDLATRRSGEGSWRSHLRRRQGG